MIGPEVTPTTTARFYGHKVMIACPWYRDVHPLTAFSVARLSEKRQTSAVLNYGDAFIAHTRNSVADLFLRSKSDWLLTIDSDMVIPFGNGEWYNAHTSFNLPEKFASLNALDRLMSHGKTLVGALYFGRWPGARAVYAEASKDAVEAEYARKAPMDLVKPTKWVGTGCMLIHRSVFEDIEKKFPCLARKADGLRGQWFTSSEHNLLDSVCRTHKMLSEGPMTGEKAHAAFQMLENALADARANSNLGAGEDVIFCRRAKAAGHTPHIDMGLLCGHVGNFVSGPRNHLQ